MDWCILQAYLWKHLNGKEPFIHDESTREVMEIAYTQKPTIKPACFIKHLQA